jgi:hypothetical protein
MEKSTYTDIGLGVSQYMQLTLSIISIFLILIFYLIGLSQSIWFAFAAIILVAHLTSYFFCDIKYNEKEFVIEKFLWRRRIPAGEFICVSKIYVFNIIIVRFTNCNYYIHPDLKSIFKDPDLITDEIKARLSSKI